MFITFIGFPNITMGKPGSLDFIMEKPGSQNYTMRNQGSLDDSMERPGPVEITTGKPGPGPQDNTSWYPATLQNQNQPQCDVCGKYFAHKRNIERHKLIHTGARPYQCKICLKAYNQKATLKAHMAVHFNKLDL